MAEDVARAVERGVDPLPGYRTYYDDPVIDQLVSLVTELGASLWIVKERLSALEGVLERAGLVSPGAVECFTRDEEGQREWLAERDAFVSRLFGSLATDHTASADPSG